MHTPKEIKTRIGAIEKIQKIASALEIVSLTRLRKIETKTEKARYYFEAMRDLAFDISGNLLYEAHPFLRPRKEVKRRAVIALFADKGLCGEFNANVERELGYVLSEKGKKNFIIAVGKKGSVFLKRKKIKPEKEYPSSLKAINHNVLASEITGYIADKFLKREIDGALIIYNQFKKQFLGKPKRLKILPLKMEGFTVRRVKDYIYEPTPYSVLETVLKEYVSNQIGQVIMESNAAEEIARMLAMKQARDNADETIKVLNLSYHKQRQMRITRELIDIATAANA